MVPADTILVHDELIDETVIASDRALGGGDAVHVGSVELSDTVPVDRGTHVRQLICDIDLEGISPACLDFPPRIHAVISGDVSVKAISIQHAFNHFERILRPAIVSSDRNLSQDALMVK